MNTAGKVVADYVCAFVSCLIAAYLATGASLFDLSVDGWKGVVSSAVAGFVPVVYTALNRRNARYGLTDGN